MRRVCFIVLILIVLVALTFVIADKFVLLGSLSFYVINALISNVLGRFVLQIGDFLFVPVFTGAAVWRGLPLILIPAALVVLKKIKPGFAAFTYICSAVFVMMLSLSLCYADYADHVAKNFVLSGEDIDVSNFASVQNTVRESKLIAHLVIDELIDELESQKDLDVLTGLDDAAYFELAETVALCFQIKGTVKGRVEHYIRNFFFRAPATLGDMIQAIKDRDPCGWTLLPQDLTVFHMQGEDGEYNVKFVSADGYHEAVYNKAGALLTELNDPDNMGTFNYADPISEPAMHAALDVLPYSAYGNCPASPVAMDGDYRYQKNPDAQNRWREIRDMCATEG